MDTKTSQIASGWNVVDSDGSTIGTVTETREDHLVVSAGTLLKHELYVPIDHITSAHDDEVVVNIRAGEVDDAGWRFPPNASYEREGPAYPEVPDTTMIQAAGYSAGRLSAPEPQGAVLNDGQIDPAEVPNADVVPDDDEDRTVENEDRLR
jgi:hypothetical protein